MSLDDTATELADRIEDQDPEELPEPASSLVERVQDALSEDGRSANLAIATGAVSLVRAVRAYRKGRRKRAALRALGGAFWIGLALVQRRRSKGSDVDSSEVADTSPDLDDVETGTQFGGEPATGGEVVDTTAADLDESDTAPELDSDVDAESDDSAMEFGEPEMDVGEVERDSGGPETDVGEVGTHADEADGEDGDERDEDESAD